MCITFCLQRLQMVAPLLRSKDRPRRDRAGLLLHGRRDARDLHTRIPQGGFCARRGRPREQRAPRRSRQCTPGAPESEPRCDHDDGGEGGWRTASDEVGSLLSPCLVCLFGSVLTFARSWMCVCVNRSKVDSAVFVLDSETQECLYYEPVRGYPPQEHTAVPREALNGHPEVEVRNDLIDCYIDICSVEV